MPAMSPRGVIQGGNRVTKPSSSSRSRKLVRSGTSQDRLEQLVAQEISDRHAARKSPEAGQGDVDVDVEDGIIKHDPSSSFDSNNQLNDIASAAVQNLLSYGDEVDVGQTLRQAIDNYDNYELPSQSPPLSTKSLTTQTAIEVAIGHYGSELKVDSHLCKKLASEVALRDPVQRRHDQRLNLGRRSNIEAVLAQVSGDVAINSCKNCRKGHGPWTECVVSEGRFCGSCSNCWYNASGSRCTFQENNNPQPQLAPFAVNSEANPVASSQPSNPPASTNASQSTVQASSNSSGDAGDEVGPGSTANGTVIANGMSNNTTINMFEVEHHQPIVEPTLHIVNEVMGHAATYNRRDRFIARIKAATKELSMRIAEYDDWRRTPEGMPYGSDGGSEEAYWPI